MMDLVEEGTMVEEKGENIGGTILGRK